MDGPSDQLSSLALIAVSVSLLPMLAIVLIVPILVGVTGDVAAGSTFASALLLGWLVVFVDFFLGASLATRLLRESRRDPAGEALRLALASGEVTPEEFENQMELL